MRLEVEEIFSTNVTQSRALVLADDERISGAESGDAT
jgi:hypothetical protein